MNAKVALAHDMLGKPSEADHLKILIIQRAGMSVLLLF
jgi:hypothetical protein